jgi:DNA-binding IclR family transcriptional regulator
MIQVVIRALDILEFVARDTEKTSSLTEIANALELNQATCANIIKTLVDKHYLEHAGRKKGYRLGAMAYHLTGNLSYSQNLVLAAKQPMEELTGTQNETSLLGIIRNNKRYIIHLVNSDQDLQVRSKSERNVYETASGRILLAFMTDNERRIFIEVNGLPEPGVWPDVNSRTDLDGALAKIRQDELSTTLSAKHIVGLAVPVRKQDKVIASLSIFLPESRYTGKRKKELIQALRDTAAKINERLTLEK